MVEADAAHRFPAVSNRWLQALMDRDYNGALNGEDRDELKSLVELSEAISLVCSDALMLLGRRP